MGNFCPCLKRTISSVRSSLENDPYNLVIFFPNPWKALRVPDVFLSHPSDTTKCQHTHMGSASHTLASKGTDSGFHSLYTTSHHCLIEKYSSELILKILREYMFYISEILL